MSSKAENTAKKRLSPPPDLVRDSIILAMIVSIFASHVIKMEHISAIFTISSLLSNLLVLANASVHLFALDVI